MTGSTPKARIGDAIVCPQGHKAGHFIKDAPADGPIRLHMLVFAGPKLFKLQAYACCDCEEPVAFLIEKGGADWKVRTPLGWIE